MNEKFIEIDWFIAPEKMNKHELDFCVEYVEDVLIKLKDLRESIDKQ